MVPERNSPNDLCRVEDMANSVKDLEHMIYGVLASYLKQLTGEPWVLFKDKVRPNTLWTCPGGRLDRLGQPGDLRRSKII